jgi:hypothetical protein
MFLNINKNEYESLHKAFYLNKFDTDYDSEDEKELNFDDFCLPFSGNIVLKRLLDLNLFFFFYFKETICEFVQELLEEKCLIDDLSFLFEMSRTHKLSPCAILIGMIYLKRLKTSSKCKNIFSSTELCLVSLVS